MFPILSLSRAPHRNVETLRVVAKLAQIRHDKPRAVRPHHTISCGRKLFGRLGGGWAMRTPQALPTSSKPIAARGCSP